MIEFKQIIGRGTRLFDGKDFFTVYDFVRAYEHFNDPEWDGEPEEPVPVTPGPPGPVTPPGPPPGPGPDPVPPPDRIKIKLAEGKELTIQHMMTTSFWSPDGKPMSAEEFIRGLYGQLPELFKDEAELRRIWSHPDTRRALLEGLSERGFSMEALTEIGKMINAEKSDLFDVLAHIAYLSPPITRTDRVEMHKDRIFENYSGNACEFLEFVLGHYIQEGVSVLDSEKLEYLIDLKYHSIADAVPELGAPSVIRELFIGFQRHLYEVIAAA